MTDHDALLRAVLADPAADLPRLVFADYLDDTGEADRAEFIRVQCKIAEGCHWCDGYGTLLGSAGDKGNPKCDRCDLLALRQREHDLFTSHPHIGQVRRWVIDTVPEGFACLVDSWCKPQHYTPETLAVVRRGFVAEVRCTLSRFAGGACGRCAVPYMHTSSGVVASPNWTGIEPCPDCSGTGDTPGIAADLFARHPVERVVLTDTTPELEITVTDLHHPSLRAWRIYLQSTLHCFVPQQAGNGWVCHGFDPERGWYNAWGTREQAEASVSPTCVKYGRKLVGLETL